MVKALLEKANAWVPNPEDPDGQDKTTFLRYLCEHCRGAKNARSINSILKVIKLSKEYTKEQFQLAVIGPLRETPDLFIGTCNRGVYLIEDASDASETIRFYTHRIRSERKHLKNLKVLIKRNRLFENYEVTPKKESKVSIYFDESGTPSLRDQEAQPYFIVTAVLVEGKKPDTILRDKISYIKKRLNKPENYELKSSRLDKSEYEMVLRELSTD